jgi:hypothetical protein
MRQVAEKPSMALAKGELGRKTVVDKLSAVAVAETIRPCFVATHAMRDTQKNAAE